MAPKVTSSSTRSSRKPANPTVVTTSKGRGNRSAVSNATVTSGRGGRPAQPTNRVTNASNRTSTGSARVTGTPRPALPPRGSTLGSRPPQSGPVRGSIGNVSGPATSPAPVRGSGRPVRTSIGNVSGPATSPSRPPAKPPAKPSGGPVRIPRPSAGALVKAIGKPNVSLASRVGNALGGSVGGFLGRGATVLAAAQQFQKITNPKDNIIHDLRNLGVAIEDKVNGKDGRRPYSGESAAAVSGNRRRGLSGEKAGPPVPSGLPNRNKPSAATPPSRPSSPPSTPPARRGGGGSPNPVSRGGDVIRERPSAAVSRPSSAPSTPKAPPAAAKPAPKAPAPDTAPNMFNTPRTGVPKFRTDMNPLGKKIVGTTNFSKSVPSERAFDTTSDYSSSLSIPDKKKRKS
jgi:DNA polymerase-3 subunit gamma/tau